MLFEAAIRKHAFECVATEVAVLKSRAVVEGSSLVPALTASGNCQTASRSGTLVNITRRPSPVRSVYSSRFCLCDPPCRAKLQGAYRDWSFYAGDLNDIGYPSLK
jgi:hypothetical protein